MRKVTILLTLVLIFSQFACKNAKESSSVKSIELRDKSQIFSAAIADQRSTRCFFLRKITDGGTIISVLNRNFVLNRGSTQLSRDEKAVVDAIWDNSKVVPFSSLNALKGKTDRQIVNYIQNLAATKLNKVALNTECEEVADAIIAYYNDGVGEGPSGASFNLGARGWLVGTFITLGILAADGQEMQGGWKDRNTSGYRSGHTKELVWR